MGSKAEYEARKQARKTLEKEDTDLELIEILDRMATAFERIADTMEPQKMSIEDILKENEERNGNSS